MDYFNAFWVGGIICVIGQILIDLTKLTPARIMVIFVVSGVVLSSVGVYAHLVEFAGCGATTPILGFGHTLANGVKRAVEQNGFLGIFTGGISGAAGGICAAIFFGYFFSMISNSRMK